MKKNFSLLDGLFSQEKSRTTTTKEEAALATTKRTFKIYDANWEDFLVLAAITKQTQAELVNELIRSAVDRNADEIKKYKELFK